MKPHEPKKQGQNKSEKEGGNQRVIKNQIKKGEIASIRPKKKMQEQLKFNVSAGLYMIPLII
jgi:hypothetical protein